MGPGPGSGPLPAGATIPQSHTEPAIDLTEVFNGFQPLFAVLTPQAINQLTGSIIDIFQGQSGTVANLVDQLAQISANLADRKEVVGEVITNLAGLLDSVAGQGHQLGSLIDNFDKVVDDVAGERAVLSSTIAALSTFAGTAAALTTAAAPAIDQDVRGVAAAAQTLTRNQGPINEMLAGAPGALQAITSVVDAGSYFKVYVCNLTLDVTGSLNLSLLPGLAAPQSPSPVSLDGVGGAVGNPALHTQVCQ
jgi:phospholipid/cholesterol/gamma-HCH transport system substrate-binding protein